MEDRIIHKETLRFAKNDIASKLDSIDHVWKVPKFIKKNATEGISRRSVTPVQLVSHPKLKIM